MCLFSYTAVFLFFYLYSPDTCQNPLKNYSNRVIFPGGPIAGMLGQDVITEQSCKRETVINPSSGEPGIPAEDEKDDSCRKADEYNYNQPQDYALHLPVTGHRYPPSGSSANAGILRSRDKGYATGNNPRLRRACLKQPSLWTWK